MQVEGTNRIWRSSIDPSLFRWQSKFERGNKVNDIYTINSPTIVCMKPDSSIEVTEMIYFQLFRSNSLQNDGYLFAWRFTVQQMVFGVVPLYGISTNIVMRKDSFKCLLYKVTQVELSKSESIPHTIKHQHHFIHQASNIILSHYVNEVKEWFKTISFQIWIHNILQKQPSTPNQKQTRKHCIPQFIYFVLLEQVNT